MTAQPWKWRGAVVALLGAALSIAIMASTAQTAWGHWLGLAALLLSIGGVLELLGVLQLNSPAVAQGPSAERAELPRLAHTVLGKLPGESWWMTPAIGVLAALLIVASGSLIGGYDWLPWMLLAGLAALVPAALRRPSLALFVAVSVVYLPGLGTFGLIDCWETHYGEVAREILARDDWVSLWWAQDGWFWSKPIFIFWSEALSMRFLGMNFSPDGHPLHPEWAVRLPMYLVSIAALLASFAAMRRIFGGRAGVLTVLVMATMPHFFFLAHQAITDMPFVGCMTVAMALFLLAMAQSPDAHVPQYRLGRWQVSAQAALIGVLLALTLPQIFYLLSRNITWLADGTLQLHRDAVLPGSAGNFGVPGNAYPVQMPPRFSALAAQPAAQAGYWLLGLAGLLWMLRRERRAQSLYMSGFYIACALAFTAKGLPGVALPGLIILLFLVAAQRWSWLVDGRFYIARGVLTAALVGMPWFVAMYARHGAEFTNRLLIHDHINRLAAGVHGDKGDISYFLRQLGYATFPWTGLLPAGLTVWLWYRRRTEAADAAAGDATSSDASLPVLALQLITLWFVASFVLFNGMITKFHHYIFPVVPAAAMLIGVVLDRFIASSGAWPVAPPIEQRAPQPLQLVGSAPTNNHPTPTAVWRAYRPQLTGLGLISLASLGLTLGIGGSFGDLRGVIPETVALGQGGDWVTQKPLPAWLCAALIAFGLLSVARSAAYLRHHNLAADDHDEPHDDVATVRGAAFLITAATIVAFVGRDLSWVTGTRPEGYERLIQLFVYMYERPWPQQFDYRPILGGFAVVATLGLAVAALPRWRASGILLTACTAVLFAAWTLNIYLRDLAPHWSERELVHRYYNQRRSADVPLVAWQMDWKGEQFYSGNRVAVFVTVDNRNLQRWLSQNAGKRAFFIFQHDRLASFRSLIGNRALREASTLREHNKFILVEVHL